MARKQLRDFSKGDLRRVIADRNRAIDQWAARYSGIVGACLTYMDGASDMLVQIAHKIIAANDDAALAEIAASLRAEATQIRRLVDQTRHENRRRLDSAPALPT